MLKRYNLRDFAPLILILFVVMLFTILKQSVQGFSMSGFMYDFMGSFFVVFSLFKIVNLSKFAQAYSMYDIIAKHSTVYAYIYPFIELALGIAFLTRYKLIAANWVMLVLMIISSIGVYRELAKGKEVVCACLGAVFKIPMTYVTLIENITMAVMAIIMLGNYYLS